MSSGSLVLVRFDVCVRSKSEAVRNFSGFGFGGNFYVVVILSNDISGSDSKFKTNCVGSS